MSVLEYSIVLTYTHHEVIMNIAVSGATGYLGYRLIKALAEKNNQILAITRKSSGRLSELQKEYQEKISICELFCDDLFMAVEKFCPDIVFSTTCCYETDSKFLERTVDSNYTFPSSLLKSAILSETLTGQAVRFINIGTSLPESLNLYSLTKKQFSELGCFFANLGKVQFVNVLLESFYGHDEPLNRFIPGCINKLLSGSILDVTEGRQKRDYICVKDVIDVLCFFAETPTLTQSYEEIPLGSGYAPSIREILEYLKQLTNSKSKINFGAVPLRKNEPDTCADLTRLRQLGYKNEMIFWKDGLKQLVEDFKNENID